MIKQTSKIYPFYFIVDLIFIFLSQVSSYLIRYRTQVFFDKNYFFFKEYSFIFILWSIFVAMSFYRKNLYSTDRSLTIPKETMMVVSTILYTGILMSAIIFFARYKFFSRQIFTMSLIQLCIFLSLWRTIKRLLLRKLIQEGFHNINVLIIGANDFGETISNEIRRNPWWGLNVVGFLDEQVEKDRNRVNILGEFKEFPVIAKKYFVDEVIVTLPIEKRTIKELIDHAKRLHLGIKVMLETFDYPEHILNINYLGIMPLLTYKERKRHPTELFLKRLFDFIIALCLLIILFPLFVIIGILIKLDSFGPVFYIQRRVGLKGKTFNLYKFRSMSKDADKLKPALLEKNEVKDGIIFKIKQDPRTTKLGLFLRRISLDELPQLVNVLKGNMSLVGPRPPLPDEVGKYNHFHMDRLSIRPGITGLSQVRGRSELTFKKWVRWDLWYINNWSFLLDLKIIWWTIPVILKGKGAY